MNAKTTLASAMAAAFPEIEAAAKAANNPHFRSKYADLSAVIDAIKPALVKHGLFFTQRCHPAEDGVSVETVLHHSEGEKESLGVLFVPANKRDAQGFGSALTYARRYGLMTAFGVPAEDDDGNAAARPSNGAAANDEPAARQKLEGPHSSKTALRNAVHDYIAKVRAATSEREVDAIMKEAKPTITQALKDWPALINGDPNIEEDIGMRGAVALKRQALSEEPEYGGYQKLVDSMNDCETLQQLTNWMAANEAEIEALPDADGRKFQLARDLKESALMTVARVNAG